jgi:hypothetical protein
MKIFACALAVSLLLAVAMSGAATAAPIAGTAAAAAQTAKPRCGSTKRPVRIKHVIWIWFENTDYHNVIGNSGAPYTNRLARACRLATDFHGLTHPSLPNYIGATSGRVTITRDCAPTNCRTTTSSLFSRAASWRDYQGGMAHPCQSQGTSTYEPEHNPAAYYTRLRKVCPTHDLPLSQFRIGRVQFLFVAPDSVTQDKIAPRGDTWLAKWLPTHVFSKKAYRNGSTVVFLTWDESYAPGNHIVLIKINRGSHGRITKRLDHHWLYQRTLSLLHL